MLRSLQTHVQRPTRIIYSVFFLAVAAAWTFFSIAAEPEVPSGMEVIEINRSKFLVPVGTKVSKKGDLYVLEPIEEYTARRLVLLELRIAALEQENKELKKEQERLVCSLQELQNDTQLKSKEKAED